MFLVLCPRARFGTTAAPALFSKVFRLDFSDSYHSGVIAWAIALCLLARAMHVYPLSFLLNRWVCMTFVAKMPHLEHVLLPT